ncbi:type II toxin-antitoxin system RelB/DinJ family antitoxin [Candidatus Parcubacteria bacterium]|nr:type II toxin-antitoxin system RelB/DinJ family antitoxin [Candidatus Parcubacteria bacterium]
MKTVLNIKTDVEVKKSAQEIAKELGLPISTIVNTFLRQFIRDKQVTFSTYSEPSDYLKKIIEEAEKDLITGKIEGPFGSVDLLMNSLKSK